MLHQRFIVQCVARWLINISSCSQSEYQEIVHNGQPGIFFPVKRQYLSMLPGVKRSTDFYPYSEGPDGRWGALVQSEVEKRRQEEMYDRLYRLAEALRGDGYSDDVYRRK